jgi:hypothetical protein
LREYVVENEFIKAVRAAGGVAYKLTSQTANGLPDRLVLFFREDSVCRVESTWEDAAALSAKKKVSLMKLGFPVLSVSTG